METIGQASALTADRDSQMVGSTPDTYRGLNEILRTEYSRRVKTNHRYSLRAFARSLKLESSYLCKILHGKRSVTPQLVERVSGKLGLTPEEMTRLKQMSRTLSSARQRCKTSPKFRRISVDTFAVVADWYHFAILELISTKDFRNDPLWIADTLGISEQSAKEAISRLERLELVTIATDGTLRCEENFTTVGNPFNHGAFQILQKAVLQKALLALDEVPVEERDQSSVTMAIDSKLLPEAKERIRVFRRQLTAFLQKSDNKDCVYHLGLSLYPVTRKVNKGEAQ